MLQQKTGLGLMSSVPGKSQSRAHQAATLQIHTEAAVAAWVKPCLIGGFACLQRLVVEDYNVQPQVKFLSTYEQWVFYVAGDHIVLCLRTHGSWNIAASPLFDLKCSHRTA